MTNEKGPMLQFPRLLWQEAAVVDYDRRLLTIDCKAAP
jgi:hypothetical protein